MSKASPLTSSTTPPTSAGSSASASGAEKSASLLGRMQGDLASASKPRSCLVCRSRKVRCDRQSPCSNCRRANIACVVPSKDRPPRWPRRLERSATGEVMDRLRTLEGLVRELRNQLERSKIDTRSATGASSGISSVESVDRERGTHHTANSPVTISEDVQKHFGRLVRRDDSNSNYLGSGFWSRVADEIEELKVTIDTGDSEVSDEDYFPPENTPSSHETARSPLERQAFLFKRIQSPFSQSPSTSDLRDFHPLPSQIPFLLNVFSDNVNILGQVVHMPTVTKMLRDLRSDVTKLTPANEALVFSIYYAAINSMEEEDVNLNFGSIKAELVSKYRFGLEHALAKADFLNVPDLVLVQAFAIFLLALNRHESPRYVWMMTGLLIRMGLALGLHRDGTRFEHLKPYEIEMRRRVWRVLCALDVRTSEAQGAEHSIVVGTSDAKMPLNINDEDITPDSKEFPPEREGLTDMSFARVWYRVTDIAMQMMAHGSETPSLKEQSSLLQEIYRSLEEGYLQHSTEPNITYRVAVTVARLVMAKMTLFIYLPVLFMPPSEDLSGELRTKLLIAAIEVAEYNHALNSEQECRHWRWMFQSYTHWHATVYLLLEIPRRPWSPLVERAWIALHSPWLIPDQSHMSRNMRVWFPLQKLLSNARRHRAKELVRLCSDAQAVNELEMEYHGMQLPSSSVAISPSNLPSLAVESNAVDIVLERWRQLVNVLPTLGTGAVYDRVLRGMRAPMNGPKYVSSGANWGACAIFDQNNYAAHIHPGQDLPSSSSIPREQDLSVNTTDAGWLWSDETTTNLNGDQGDVSVDMDCELDWYDWVESLKGMEVDGASWSYSR